MLLDDQTHQIFGIAESRLDVSVDFGLINIPGYSVDQQDCHRGGGGILLYIHNKLKTMFCTVPKQHRKKNR